jgi:putative aldouronate transport system permease protein
MLEFTPKKLTANVASSAFQKTRWTRFRRWTLPFIPMALPAVVWLLVFSYAPMFGLIIAFKNYKYDKGIFDSAWVGLENFRYLFATKAAREITFNTLYMNAIFIVSTLVVSIAVAILAYSIKNHFITKYYQSAMFLPFFISYIIVAIFVQVLLGNDTGMINRLLQSWGRPGVDWYASPQYWPAILALVNLWKSVGFWSLIYFAGLLGINPEFYEAAEVDGAGSWAKLVYITLPLLIPLVIINMILSVGRIFYADFGLFYQVTMNRGQLFSTTNVIDTYVYRSLVTTGDIGMASAAGFYQAIVGFALVLGSNLIVRRIDPDKAVF